MEKKKSKGSDRTRNYATIIYLDSAPENWREILSDFKIPAFVSPYHDKDVRANGEPKKPHYHVQLLFDGVKSKDQAKAIFDAIGGAGLEVVQSCRGYARYLCHLDDPDKAQYNTDEVWALCGADYIGTIGLSSDKYKAIGEMIDFCDDSGIVSYSDLLRYARLHRYDWFRVLCDNGTVVIKEFLKSKAWTEREEKYG